MKRTLSIILMLIMLFPQGISVMAAPVYDEAYVTVNGIVLDVPAYIIDGRTLVPMRSVFEALNATVDWNEDERTVYAQKNGISITLPLGSSEMSVLTKKGTEIIQLDVPARTIVSSAYIPLRAVAEALDCNVFWDNDLKRAAIEFDEEQPVYEETSTEASTEDVFDETAEIIYDKEDENNTNRIDGIVTFQSASSITILTAEGKKITFEKTPYIYKDRANAVLGMAVTVFYEGALDGAKPSAAKVYRTHGMESLESGSMEFYTELAKICNNNDLSALGDICEYPVNVYTIDGFEACESKEYFMQFVTKYVITEELKTEINTFDILKLLPDKDGNYKIGGNINIIFKKTDSGYKVTSITAAQEKQY